MKILRNIIDHNSESITLVTDKGVYSYPYSYLKDYNNVFNSNYSDPKAIIEKMNYTMGEIPEHLEYSEAAGDE